MQDHAYGRKSAPLCDHEQYMRAPHYTLCQNNAFCNSELWGTGLTTLTAHTKHVPSSLPSTKLSTEQGHHKYSNCAEGQAE